MLTGNLPFKATTAAAMIMSHIHKNPSPMSKYKEGLPPALEAAVMHALVKNPEKRPQSI